METENIIDITSLEFGTALTSQLESPCTIWGICIGSFLGLSSGALVSHCPSESYDTAGTFRYYDWQILIFLIHHIVLFC